MTCTKKHTKFQPTEEQWRCPSCESKNLINDSYVELRLQRARAEGDVLPADEDDECLLLHPTDQVYCDDCNYVATGRSLSSAIVKKLQLEPCSCCKGTGYVSRSK